MVKPIEGRISAQGLRVAIVASRWNGEIVDKLVAGAIEAITAAGGREADIALIRVPGALEIPQALRRVVERGGVDAIVTLGCVIRGETPHFEYVAGAASDGVAEISARSSMPITFGVLTVESFDQAMARAGGKVGNKGEEAAVAAIELVNLFRELAR
jgi:6,7-dimethyl-8-ribityllumazine synthase